MKVKDMDTPIGKLWLGEKDGGISLVSVKRPAEAEESGTELLERAAKQLAEYFAGERRAFDLPLRIEAEGFAKRVYEELAKVPYGETVSYRQLAEAAGSPRAARAAGNVCGANPILVLIPCHRVICSDGRLGGFALGAECKRRLLGREIVNLTGKEPNTIYSMPKVE